MGSVGVGAAVGAVLAVAAPGARKLGISLAALTGISYSGKGGFSKFAGLEAAKEIAGLGEVFIQGTVSEEEKRALVGWRMRW